MTILFAAAMEVGPTSTSPDTMVVGQHKVVDPNQYELHPAASGQGNYDPRTWRPEARVMVLRQSYITGSSTAPDFMYYPVEDLSFGE